MTYFYFVKKQLLSGIIISVVYVSVFFLVKRNVVDFPHVEVILGMMIGWIIVGSLFQFLMQNSDL